MPRYPSFPLSNHSKLLLLRNLLPFLKSALFCTRILPAFCSHFNLPLMLTLTLEDPTSLLPNYWIMLQSPKFPFSSNTAINCTVPETVIWHPYLMFSWILNTLVSTYSNFSNVGITTLKLYKNNSRIDYPFFCHSLLLSGSCLYFII